MRIHEAGEIWAVVAASGMYVGLVRGKKRLYFEGELNRMAHLSREQALSGQ